MFNIDNIYTDFTGKRFLCDYLFNSEKAAKYIEAKFLMSVKEVFHHKSERTVQYKRSRIP